MGFYVWFIVVGLLLVIMALAASILKRLPLSASILYLATGVLVGPLGLGLLTLDPLGEGEVKFIERLSETVVVLSLFAAGLKMRIPFRDARWRLPLLLAFVSMDRDGRAHYRRGRVVTRAAAGRRGHPGRGARAHRPGAGLGTCSSRTRATATSCVSRSPARPVSTTARRFLL